MINLSKNLFSDDLDVFFESELIGTIEIITHMELYKCKPINGQDVMLRSLNLCQNYFKNLSKGRPRTETTDKTETNQLNLF
jgi:hypothetical protein